jgi:hypothetical protein
LRSGEIPAKSDTTHSVIRELYFRNVEGNRRVFERVNALPPFLLLRGDGGWKQQQEKTDEDSYPFHYRKALAEAF